MSGGIGSHIFAENNLINGINIPRSERVHKWAAVNESI